ncbi:MAG: hypothetical protein HYS12_20830 [Planctomycetes bacterium]|nr:hypothetical protein [Planctomycetota bacterium]
MAGMRFIAGLFLLALLVPPAAAAEKPFRYPEGKHGKGELKCVNGVPVLTVEGTPEEIGEQIAMLTIKPVGGFEKLFQEFLKFQRAEKLWPFLVKACTTLYKRMPADHVKEIDALARTSGVDRDIFVVANTIMDVMKLGGCSTLVVEPSRSATGQLLFGRNFDFPPLGGDLAKYTLVMIYRPKGKRAFAAVGFPGLIGHPTGINEAGVALASNEITSAGDGSPRFDPAGVPMASYFRRVMEECGSVAEVDKLLRSVQRTTMGSLTVCDKKEGVVFEVTTKTVAVRRAEKGVCVCTNHFVTEGLANSRGCWRWPILEKARGLEKVKLPDVAKKLDEVNQGQFTIQTMVFEPAALRLHLAFGKGPCTTQPLTKLELAKYLRP